MTGHNAAGFRGNWFFGVLRKNHLHHNSMDDGDTEQKSGSSGVAREDDIPRNPRHLDSTVNYSSNIQFRSHYHGRTRRKEQAKEEHK